MRLLSQICGLKSLGLINCKQLFMSGMFLSNQAERKTFEERLQGKKVRKEGGDKFYDDQVWLVYNWISTPTSLMCCSSESVAG